jgi:nitroimidazol reductase NimA-like FMN-containing flavoprotein (pyridoxamine 5'-phosphate oxidase superfamily)
MKSINVEMRSLDRREAELMLSQHHTGRMAFAFHDKITIELVNYVYADGWIYARIEQGPALTTLRHHQWVAFEVDELQTVYDWRTVTVHGSLQFLSDDRSSPDWRDFNRAAELIRAQVPSVLTADDPLPNRNQVYRIHVDELLGRESRSNEPQQLPSV